LISLKTQEEARYIRDLSFCYLCGKDFKTGDSINYDHIPPKSVFDNPDRNFPIKLSTHEKCHSPINLDDEVLGQLVALIHGKQPSENNDKLKLDFYQLKESGETIAAFSQRNIEFLLKRWLRGFHTALYHEPLEENTHFEIHPPFPSGNIKEEQLVDEPIRELHYKIVECIKRNRATGNIDYIESNNGKLLYECVWDRMNDNRWACIFALDLYGWKDLGDINNFQARGCAGLYFRPSGNAPINACLGTQLEFSLENLNTADPFAS